MVGVGRGREAAGDIVSEVRKQSKDECLSSSLSLSFSLQYWGLNPRTGT